MADLFVERHFSSEYPELLREIATELFLQLSEQADCRTLGEERIAAIAYRVAEHIRHELGGRNLYLARGVLHECSQRDREMFEQFRGDYRVLAEQYDLTEMRIRQIIERCRRAEATKRQGQLFDATQTAAVTQNGK